MKTCDAIVIGSGQGGVPLSRQNEVSTNVRYGSLNSRITKIVGQALKQGPVEMAGPGEGIEEGAI